MDIDDDSADESELPYDDGHYGITAQQAIRAAESEGLTLVRSSRSLTGFVGVFNPNNPARPNRPYLAKLRRRDGYLQYLGCYATAEEAALTHARALGPGASAAAAAAERAEELRRRMRKLRRHAFIVGKAASFLQTIYNEVTYRPGNQGQKRSREEFEAALAAQHA